MFTLNHGQSSRASSALLAVNGIQPHICPFNFGNSIAGTRLAPLTSLSTARRRRRSASPAYALFGFLKKSSPVAPVTRSTVIPEPSFNLAIGLTGIAGALAVSGKYAAAVLPGALGILLTVQTTRVRFLFTDTALEVRAGSSEIPEENKFVGGESRWDYSTFTNWEFWWPQFPILVYFKENQTKPEGQIHFFPVLFNGKQLYDVMVERCGNSQNSLPKPADESAE